MERGAIVIADLVHDLVLGFAHTLAYIALTLFLGSWLLG